MLLPVEESAAEEGTSNETHEMWIELSGAHPWSSRRIGRCGSISTPHPGSVIDFAYSSGPVAAASAIDRTSAAPAGPINVLVVGANGYLGSAVCRAFLRTACPLPSFFRVYGLVRRQGTAASLAADEVIPVVGSVAASDAEATAGIVLSHANTWHVIVICTEPSKIDPVSEDQHWRGLLALVKALSQSSASPSRSPPTRPMVLWSSGCKDYGTTKLYGDQGLLPHAETSPLVPHPLVRGRMDAALRAVEASRRDGEESDFDVAVIRATPLYGYSSSYYGAAFDYMSAYKAAVSRTGDKVLKLAQSPGTILHGIHVDDCGDAYVALAKTALWSTATGLTAPGGSNGVKAGRAAVAGEAFNRSGRRYETLEHVGAALAAEYGLSDGVEFNVPVDELPEDVRKQDTALVFGYSQWVASDKIRSTTSWSDTRPLFSQNIGVYRLAYDAAQERGSDNITKTRQRMAGIWGD
ncbi:NAD(P)-binding domain protein [Metarhizium guizhouense ARSEF 977]|uniref:NAD(P)-binding domain protein n=1 Tax=Metarhizium guizhouense (strain ARSEF 977) TaxID=1276136 RepID=A0A0B4G4F3_METGA|nr:NAD(P)-binding domain protein [Metarhizium guizhouense ARSEF 977]